MLRAQEHDALARMQTTVTLNEEGLTAAIDAYLQAKGLKVRGNITVNHYQGDCREPASTTVTVQVEAK